MWVAAFVSIPEALGMGRAAERQAVSGIHGEIFLAGDKPRRRQSRSGSHLPASMLLLVCALITLGVTSCTPHLAFIRQENASAVLTMYRTRPLAAANNGNTCLSLHDCIRLALANSLDIQAALWEEQVRAKLPELPEARRDRFMQEYGLPQYDADLLTGSKLMADYFEECLKVGKGVPPKEVSNWLLGEVSRIINEKNIDIDEFRKRVSPEHLSELALSSHSQINIATAKPVLEEMFQTGKTADVIINEKGLLQISDTKQLEETILEVINSNTQAVADYSAGKETALKFLVGQVMKATRGRANPKLVNEVLKQKLAEALNTAGKG